MNYLKQKEMCKINVLDSITINQIAAGEVIENSSSILKELLENSRDAGAMHIRVESRGGGRVFLSVSDDGEGMEEEDVKLSIQRHATSKIKTAADLISIRTLGFRGEALSSIAAVSKMTVHSSSGGHGTILKVSGGYVEDIGSKARKRGTTIEVRQLFYNVPARLAFQNSLGADTAELHRTLVKFALSAPAIGLIWEHEGKVQWEVPAKQTLAERIPPLLGQSFFDELMPVEDFGFIGVVGAHRSNRREQYLMLNDRVVTCPAIAFKVLESYGTRLPPRRFPVFILSLYLPSEWMDVNVHPQKREVRLRKETSIVAPLQEAIAKAFNRQHQTGLPWMSTPTGTNIPQKIGEDFWIFDKSLDQMTDISASSEEKTLHLIPRPISSNEDKRAPALLESEIQWMRPLLNPIGVFAHYLILAQDEGLLWINLHRALYRIRYEQQNGSCPQQTLLIPYTLDVEEHETKLLLEKQHKLLEQGMNVRHFGGNTFLVEAMPPWMEVSEIEECLSELIHNRLDLGAKLIAKRGRKNRYHLNEAIHIWEEFLQKKYPVTTPDGEPVTMMMKKEKIDGLFKQN